MARNTPVLAKLIKKYTSGNIDLPIMFFDKLLENFEQNMIHQKALQYWLPLPDFQTFRQLCSVNVK